MQLPHLVNGVASLNDILVYREAWLLDKLWLLVNRYVYSPTYMSFAKGYLIMIYIMWECHYGSVIVVVELLSLDKRINVLWSPLSREFHSPDTKSVIKAHDWEIEQFSTIPSSSTLTIHPFYKSIEIKFQDHTKTNSILSDIYFVL